MNALLLLLGDGRFPGGGHAHSGGVEAAVADGAVHDAASLYFFLEGRLLTAGATDAWAAAAACAGPAPDVVEAEYESRCPSPVLRAASRAQGRGLKRAAAQSWPAVADVDVEHHAVVVGVVAREAGLTPAEAAALVVHSSLMGAASAAVRLLALDMADAAAVVARLAPVADTVASSQTSPSLEIGPTNGHERSELAHLERVLGSRAGPVWSAPMLERRAEEHARWEVRLFAS
jgi:urease accessory protein